MFLDLVFWEVNELDVFYCNRYLSLLHYFLWLEPENLWFFSLTMCPPNKRMDFLLLARIH